MNVNWNEGTSLIDWDEGKVQIDFPAPVQHLKICESEPRVLVIYGESLPENRLRALSSSGEIMFDTEPPPERSFFCFSRYESNECVVVCTESDGEMDWLYSIDAERQELVSLNRAF